MKWDVKLPDWADVVRLEVKSREENERWATYIRLALAPHQHICWMVGQDGLPFRFEAATQNEAEKKAKDYLEEHYKVVRKIWP